MATTIDFNSIIQFTDKQKEVLPLIGKKKYIFYGGARAGGKTYLSVGVSILLALMFPKIKITFIRSTLRELKEEIILRFLDMTPSELYKWRATDKVLIFYNGSRISFVSMQDYHDVAKEKGIERHMYVVDEATDINEKILTGLPGSLRNTSIEGWRPCILYTGNPGGVSDSYFRKYFVLPHLRGTYDGWTEKQIANKDSYAFVQSSVDDNPHILQRDPEYLDFLDSLPTEYNRAWRYGDWFSFTGKFFSEWDERVHMVNDFEPDEKWVKWRAIDLGYQSHPSVCLWLTQNPDNGVVYVYRELGFLGSPNDFAREIVSMSRRFNNESYMETFADPNMFATNNEAYDESRRFLDAGIFIKPAFNGRHIGWRNLKDWLHHDPYREPKIPPRLCITQSCMGLRRTIPMMRYRNDYTFDLNTRDEDDFVDALRYGMVHLDYGKVYQGVGVYSNSASYIDDEFAKNSMSPTGHAMTDNASGHIRDARGTVLNPQSLVTPYSDLNDFGVSANTNEDYYDPFSYF